MIKDMLKCERTAENNDTIDRAVHVPDTQRGQEIQMQTVAWKGRFGPFNLNVGPATFKPSTVSTLLANSLEVEDQSIVVDAGCGSGILGIVAAKLGAKEVYGVDPAENTVTVAAANAEAQGVSDITKFFQGDMFDPLPMGLKADVVIGDVSGIPDEFAEASGWFPSGLSGGPTGAELPMRMLDEARSLLRKGGKLFLPTGTIQDEESILDKAKSTFSSVHMLTERAIPLPSTLKEHPAIIKLIKYNIVKLTQRGRRMLWMARIWECNI